MLKSRTLAFAIALMVLIGMTPFRGQSGAATTLTTRPSAGGPPANNNFVGRWSSQIKNSSGHVFDDGVLDIADATEPSADEVSVLHSERGGPFIGHTMSYPDRIEIQISLGDGHIVHYNGVLVSPTRIEGSYFVTGDQQGHHARKHAVLGEDDWRATAQQ
jgi:hypothetical protein